MNPKILVMTGDGINCERETARAIAMAGGQGVIVHINDLIHKVYSINDFHGMVIPGGFSFGDELGSGQILAKKIETHFMNELKQLIRDQKPILGICNGFQVLVKLGLLPGQDVKAALNQNRDKKFIDEWSQLSFDDSTCLKWWRPTGNDLCFPIRHGEGNLVLEEADNLEILKSRGQIVYRYFTDFNGSIDRIGALCDSTGIVLGMMPHPEAAVTKFLRPEEIRNREPDHGLDLFRQMISFVS